MITFKFYDAQKASFYHFLSQARLHNYKKGIRVILLTFSIFQKMILAPNAPSI